MQTAVSIGIHTTKIPTADSIAVIMEVIIIQEKHKVAFHTNGNTE